jgi:hypothetical protein
MAPVGVIQIRNAAHFDGLMSPGSKAGDGKPTTRIKED